MSWNFWVPHIHHPCIESGVPWNKPSSELGGPHHLWKAYGKPMALIPGPQESDQLKRSISQMPNIAKAELAKKNWMWKIQWVFQKTQTCDKRQSKFSTTNLRRSLWDASGDPPAAFCRSRRWSAPGTEDDRGGLNSGPLTAPVNYWQVAHFCLWLLLVTVSSAWFVPISLCSLYPNR